MSIVKGSENLRIELRKGDARVCLAGHLGEEFTGGSVVRLVPGEPYGVEGMDELSSSYEKKNWLSGVASGAFYAYRALGETRRVLYLTEFTGRLHSADMSAVADAAARLVADCLHRKMPAYDSEGWQLETPEPAKNGVAPVHSN
jgi:hypothetical protein